MKTDPAAFCRRQSRRFPLGETRDILDEQFVEMNETLSRLLGEASEGRTQKHRSHSILRREIESMLGHWTLHRVDPKPRVRRLARSKSMDADSVEWTTTDGIHVDGILLSPKSKAPLPAILYVPDCSESSEEVCSRRGAASRLAQRGFVVLALRLISRRYSEGYRLNNRRHLHRLGWQLGRTFLGAEVSKLRSAVGALSKLPQVDANRIGVFGFDQGGQLALLAAALDDRIKATVVSNYFGGGVHPEWQPVDRLLFGKAHLFGESELADLIGSQRLCVEADTRGRWPENGDAKTELEREQVGFTRGIDFTTSKRLAGQNQIEFVASKTPCSDGSVIFLNDALRSTMWEAVSDRRPSFSFHTSSRPSETASHVAAAKKELVRFAELENHYNRLLTGARTRRRRSSRNKLAAYFDVIGHFPQRPRSFEARWKLVCDVHKFTGYETTISVRDGLQTYGVLLVPKDIRPGDRRPAVVCQHGFQGQPLYAVGFHTNEQAKAYNMFAARLAERGYVVFSPYLCVPNSEQRTRLVTKAWLLGGMPIGLETQKFSRAVDFLESLPFVDRNRIGFYGLSYGGYTALWFTPAEPRFKVVICSGHFNDWQRKTTDLSFKPSCYLYHPDEDMYNHGLMERLDHVDLAVLCAPRPFAVEAGLQDGVFKMEWVRSEFRRVKEIYRTFGKPENAQLFEFDGPHEVHGKDTFPFLDRWLRHDAQNK